MNTVDTIIDQIAGAPTPTPSEVVDELNFGILQTTRLRDGSLMYSNHLVAGDIEIDLRKVSLEDLIAVAQAAEEEDQARLTDDTHLALRAAYSRVGEECEDPHELESLFFYLDSQYERDQDDEAVPALTERAIKEHIEAVQTLDVWRETATILVTWSAVKALCADHIARLVEE